MEKSLVSAFAVVVSALAALDKAERSLRYTEKLKARLRAHVDGADPELDALKYFIGYVLANPGSIALAKAERILRKRGFLDDPAIIGSLQSPSD
jgi:hypothetical protein